ncbi:MAG TPA: hypothetical protein VMS31_14375 [Pyrinomonadaceae bacterium]|nr:hypothetical protein [Pyrinomonadaceae bacterium]
MSKGRTIIVACGLVALAGWPGRVWSQSPKPPLPNSHRHFGVTRSGVGEHIPKFAMVEASLEAGIKKEDLQTDRSRKYDAFTSDGTRLFVTERGQGRTFEIRGLPLEWRPFSNLTWANNQTLMFDRWSQPHYGVHYSVNVKSRTLIAAAPFPDKFYLEQQRPKRKNTRRR